GSGALIGVLALPAVDLLQQRVHHLRLQHLSHLLAVAEDHALTVAGGDADVRLAGLAGPVDHAAEHADLHRRPPPLHPLLQVRADLLQVDRQPAAGRAGDQFRSANAPLRRLQDVEGRRDLRYRIAQEAYADRVADAVEQ